MEGFFSKDDTIWGFKPHKYECPVCGGNMLVHSSSFGRPPGRKGYIFHQLYKCVNCFLARDHEIPVSKEYYDEIEERRGGKERINAWEDKEELEKIKEKLGEKDQKTVEKRLKHLGYY